MKTLLKALFRLLCTALVVMLLLVLVWWGNESVKTDEYEYPSARLPAAFEGFRVVQLSDLHGREFGEGGERLIEAVRAAKPDLIALTGDFVDEESTVEDVLPTLRGIAAIAPAYFVTGNHEWGSHQTAALQKALRELGVTCLENQFVRIERDGEHILLAGIHDPNGFADQKTPEQLAAELYAAEEDPYWLLLAHRNNRFNGGYCRLGADLTLSGHAHGGVWRLPFTDGLIDSEYKWFPAFTSGFYHCTDSGCAGAWVFVSRGLGNSPHKVPRIFNRPQVAVITLTRGK